VAWQETASTRMKSLFNFTQAVPRNPKGISSCFSQSPPINELPGNFEVTIYPYDQYFAEMPVKPTSYLFVFAHRRDCFYLYKIIAEFAVRALGIILFMQLNAIHDGSEKFSDVAIYLNVFTCFAVVFFGYGEQVPEIWNQRNIRVGIFMSQLRFAFQLSQATVSDFFRVNNAVPVDPFSIHPKGVVGPQFFHRFLQLKQVHLCTENCGNCGRLGKLLRFLLWHSRAQSTRSPGPGILSSSLRIV